MKCEKDIVNRLKRTQGQMHGVLNLVEKEASCQDIVTQLKAIKSSIEKTIGIISTKNLIQNIEEKYKISIDDMKENIDLIIKSI